jgi:hypothetical protein
MELGRKADAVRASLAAVKHKGASIQFSQANADAVREVLQVHPVFHDWVQLRYGYNLFGAILFVLSMFATSLG